MPKYLENPSILTKDQLKSDLKTNGVSLPRGEQRKQVYVDLYLKHLTSQNEIQSNGIVEFSSDEEDDRPSPKKPPQRSQKALIRKPVKGLPYDVSSLSDGDLARQLRNYGQVVGPITETTRPLYQKKLVKLLQDEMKNPASVQPPNATPKAWEYSDNEEDNLEASKTSLGVEDKSNEQQGEKHVITIQDDDIVDSLSEPPQLTHKTKERPYPPRQSTPKKVITRETVVSESHVETRKRVVEKKPEQKTIETKLPAEVKSRTMGDVAAKSESSWEWKAVLVVLVIITVILLVYYFMEGVPSTPNRIQ